MQVQKDKKWTGLYLLLSFLIILAGYAGGVMETFGGTLLLLVLVAGLLPLLMTWLNLMIEQIRSKGFVERMNGVISEYQAREAGTAKTKGMPQAETETDSVTDPQRRKALDLQFTSAPAELYARLKELEPEAKTDMGRAILNLNLAQTLMLLDRAGEAEVHIRVCDTCRYPNPVFRTELARTKAEVLTKLDRRTEAAEAYAQWEAYRERRRK